MKSEFGFAFTPFKNEKLNENFLKSRMKSEMKMPRDRDRKVKFQKNISRILEKQDSRRLLAKMIRYEDNKEDDNNDDNTLMIIMTIMKTAGDAAPPGNHPPQL